MAPNDSAETPGGATGTPVGRRRAARYIVPVAVAGVAAATIGLVPALASTGDPDLPEISAQELIERIAASDEERLSGTFKISTDLGLPLDGLAGAFLQGGAGGDGGEGGAAAPQEKLMELASGTHTLRVAADGPERQKLSVLGNASEYSVIHNQGEVWAYDSASGEVYHAEAPGGRTGGGHPEKAPKGAAATPKDFAEQALAAAGDTTSVTVGGTARVAGRDAYQLVIEPKQSGSTIGSVRIAVDAENGVPLKFTLSAAGGGKAVVDAGFTKVDFSKPAASTFDFTPPKGAKVTEADEREDGGKGAASGDGAKAFEKALPGHLAELDGFEGLNVIGEGWTSIAEIRTPGGTGLPAPGGEGVPAEAQGFLDALGDKVTGKFGSGTVFTTRLVNALLTEDGSVYVGAVTKDALVRAADAAAR